MSSNPHASPSRLSANSFFPHTHTHRQKDGCMHTCSNYYGTHTPQIHALQSHTEIQGFVQGINKPFQVATRRGWLSHTPNTAREIQGQKVRHHLQQTAAIMWSKLRVETEIAEGRGEGGWGGVQQLIGRSVASCVR